MEKGQHLTQVIAANPAHLADPNFALALALLTFGCPRDPMANGGDVVEFKEDVAGQVARRFVFVFDDNALTAGEKTSVWITRWNDPAWLAANPEHPFAWLRKSAENYAAFAGWMKVHVPVLVFRNQVDAQTERVAYVPADQLHTELGRKLLAGAGLAA